ncbi:MAG: GntR family transcriptional regulator [Hyphomicrobiaceae bacterium]
MTRTRTVAARSEGLAAVARGALPLEAGRAEVVYRDIHLAIVEHRLPPGTRLPEAHLADVFGVSRTLVRQALQRLAHDHLVVLEPNRGAHIAEPTIDEVRQLYEVRRLIECNILAEGAGRLTRARLAALRRKVASEAQANARGDTLISMQLAGAFHLDLAEAFGNLILVDILGELIARGNVAIALYEQQGRDICRCDDHRQIVRLLAADETAAAVSAMRRHLLQIEESLTVARPPRGPVNLRAVLGRTGVKSAKREQQTKS